MVTVRPIPESDGFSSKPKQAKLAAKKVGVHFQPVASTKEWYAAGRRIKEALSLYRKLLTDKKLLAKLLQEQEKKSDGRKNSGLGVHMRVAKVLERSGKSVNTVKQTGHVLGVKVGDEFHWRGELCVVGLHLNIQKGIDCMQLINGTIIATSIVDSGRYDNSNTPDSLSYCGEGENPNVDLGRKHKDQKLAGGNLALKNSMDLQMPVRVIRRVEQFSDTMTAAGVANDCGYKFVYYGLYRVTKCWAEKGKLGTNVYKFSLERIYEEQTELGLDKRNRVENDYVGRVSHQGYGKQKYIRY